MRIVFFEFVKFLCFKQNEALICIYSIEHRLFAAFEMANRMQTHKK